MSTIYAHYENHKDARFSVDDSYGGKVVVRAETYDGGLDVGLFMQREQAQMLLLALVEYLQGGDSNGKD